MFWTHSALSASHATRGCVSFAADALLPRPHPVALFLFSSYAARTHGLKDALYAKKSANGADGSAEYSCTGGAPRLRQDARAAAFFNARLAVFLLPSFLFALVGVASRSRLCKFHFDASLSGQFYLRTATKNAPCS